VFSNTSERMMHSIICVAVFLGWFSCFFLLALIPGYSVLYRSGLALPFLNIVILLPYAIFSWRLYVKQYPFLSLGRFSWRGLLLPLVALIALTFIYGQFAQPESWMNELPQQSSFTKWLMILSICLVAPVSEEIVFRGLMLNSSIGWGKSSKTLGIAVVSLIFSLVHSQYDSVFTFIYLFIFSSILCVVRINTRGLLMPMILHGINNSLAVLGVFYLNSAG
jgi:CAAX amino terminal protease family.